MEAARAGSPDSCCSCKPEATRPGTLRKWEAPRARGGCAQVSIGVGGGVQTPASPVSWSERVPQGQRHWKSLQPQAWHPDQRLDGRPRHRQRTRRSR